MNPLRPLAEQFASRSPTTLLAIGVGLAIVDLVVVYLAAAMDGAIHINQGIGLANHYGYFATVFGNAIALYAARKYYDGVCSIRTSNAVSKKEVIENPLQDLSEMIELRGRYQFIIYLLLVIGGACWVANFAIHLLGNPIGRWGVVFDSRQYGWSFVVGRLHLFYSWVVIMPYVVYVMICASIQLKTVMISGSVNQALKYDLLNPDQRGGFGFADNAALAFNTIAALAYVEITLHIQTFARVNAEHVLDLIISTALLLGINNMFFVRIYATIKRLRFDALNAVKKRVFRRDKLSFEILKYSYDKKLQISSIAKVLIQSAAIAIPAIVRFWPLIKNAFARA